MNEEVKQLEEYMDQLIDSDSSTWLEYLKERGY